MKIKENTLNSTIGKKYPVKTPNSGFENAAKNDRLKTDPAGVMVSIIKQQRSEYAKEISHWKSARILAKQVYLPRRTLLYELYDSIMTDMFVFGQIQNRINRICNKPFKIFSTATDKADKDKTNFFKKAWVYDFIKLALESKFYGYSLIYTSELLGTEIKAVKLVDRQHVVPSTKLILKQISDSEGINYVDDPEIAKYCIGVGKDDDLGLLDKIAPLYILKKHSWANWDQFEEMFGIPIRIAKSASRDKKVQDEMEAWLRDMGSAGYGMFPQDAELEIIQSSSPDAFRVFDMKRKACNEEIALGINGQFETSTSTGSNAKSKTVVASTQDELTADDLRFIYYVINDQLLPLMQGLGYDINDDTDDFEWDLTVELPPEEKIKIYESISKMGFELDADDIYKTFGVKITGKAAIVPPPPIIAPVAEPLTPETKPNKAVENLLKMHTQIAKLYSNV
jgi:hypothetical protein